MKGGGPPTDSGLPILGPAWLQAPILGPCPRDRPRCSMCLLPCLPFIPLATPYPWEPGPWPWSYHLPTHPAPHTALPMSSGPETLSQHLTKGPEAESSHGAADGGRGAGQEKGFL